MMEDFVVYQQGEMGGLNDTPAFKNEQEDP